MDDKIYQSKNYGGFIVIGEGDRYNYLRVRFVNTGHEYEFRKDAVQHGEVRDRYAVSFLGVGVIGNIKTRGKYKKLYTCWRNMIYRCYAGKNKAYDDVSVCDRWKTFEYFCDDVKLVDGWDADLFDSGKLVIDKDIKQRHANSKIYSIETCMWVAKEENSSIQDKQQKEFIGISPTGDVVAFDNISKAARTIGVDRRQVSSVLHGRYKTTLGWKFYYTDKEIV